MTPHEIRAEIRSWPWLLPIGLGVFALASMALNALPYFFAASDAAPASASTASAVEARAGTGASG